MFSFPECITWLAVGLTESVAIVTLNIITLVVFIQNRYLRRRSTYLVLNLVVVDTLTGVTAVYYLYYGVGKYCNLWKPARHWITFFITIFFMFGSLTSITAIALERFYATFWPFKHRLLKKSVYVFFIAFVWLAAGLLSIIRWVLLVFTSYKSLWFLFCSICLLLICVSYASIVIKVRCGAHHGASCRERKLTLTLLIVTFLSLVLYLPDNLYHFLDSATDIISSMSQVTSKRLHNVLHVLFYANSLVNPILYAIRMPEYRSAVLAFFRRRPQQQRQAAVFPLRDM